MLLLVYPPISIPSEPPIGIARLSGALKAHNIPHEVIDANIEGIHWLFKNTALSDDTWSKRARKNLEANICAIKDGSAFKNISRYKKTVLEINRLLEMAGLKKEVKITLTDYVDKRLLPVKSAHLIASAKNFNKNPFFEYFSNRLEAVLKKENIDIAGFSINYLGQALCAFSMIGYLKDTFPRIKVIIGGGLINSWVKRGLKKHVFNGLVDEMIGGPGETPLLSMLGIKACQKRQYKPVFEKFKKELYLSSGIVLPYNTSTGCYWNRCTFCPERAERNEYLQIPPEIAVKELKEIIDTYNPALIHLTDNAIHPGMLNEIIGHPLSVPWYGFVRVHPRMEDLNYIKALKESGCVLLKIGIESAHQEVLDKMKKGLNIEMAKRVLKNLKAAGIGTYIYLLFGTPYETEESLKKTMEFVITHKDLIDFMNIAIFNMPVNSHDEKDITLKDFYDGDLCLYTDFIHPRGLSRGYIRRFLEKTFKKHRDIRSIIDRQPRFFTSSHAPFFVMTKS